MSITAIASPKVLLPALAGLLALGAGYWHFAGAPAAPGGPVIPQEFTVAALKATEPEKAMSSFRQVMEREDLSEEQRRQIMENADQVREDRREEAMNEYFNAPASERTRILDKQIDEMERFRKEREAEREAREKERENMTEEQREKEREKWRNMFRGRENATQAERKTRAESRSADKSGRRMLYRAVMMDRMKERGIQPPRWGPGGPGGGPPRRGG
jgi:hypothetical protein